MSVHRMKRGAFIVFEGLDRSGKSTQAKKLVEKLESEEIPAELIQFPDRTTSIGRNITNYLSNKEDFSDQAIHLLFAADRWEHEQKMKDLLLEGVTIVADRYSYSGVAYSSAKGAMSFDWCKHPEAGLPKPDLVFFMRMLAKTASEREAFGLERYERNNFLEKVNQNYMKLIDDSWKIIDGDKAIDEIHEKIVKQAKEVIDKVSGTLVKTLW